jgi:hypothetical protein
MGQPASAAHFSDGEHFFPILSSPHGRRRLQRLAESLGIEGLSISRSGIALSSAPL